MIRCPFRHLYSTPSKPSAPLAVLLRERTADAHKRAEHHPLQQALVRGRVTKEQFIRVANEMRFVHLAGHVGVERLLKEPRTKSLAEFLGDRDEMFMRDLAALGSAPTEAPTCEATKAFEATLDGHAREGRIPELIGHAYVLEGITNSGFYIAQAVERTLRLDPGQGTTWLNPYREEVRARWEQSRDRLNAIEVSAEEAERAVEGARATFLAMEAVMGELRVRE